MINRNILADDFGISQDVIFLFKKAENDIKTMFDYVDEIVEYNQYKVLFNMQKNKLSDIHFNGTTGYGYDDIGRDTIEKIFAGIFGAEDALVRSQIVSGTHAIALCLFSNLRPGDELIFACGEPYDTLKEIIGDNVKSEGSLMDYGISYKKISLQGNGKIDMEALLSSITNATKMVMIQRSKGYDYRQSLFINDINEAITNIKNRNKNIIVFVDNCYGEFTEFNEPTEVGADLIAGSLIKNAGGGIAPTGGYVIGKRELVEKAAYKLYAPGIGKRVGPTLGVNRLILQGLFLAPDIVGNALKGSILISRVMELLGYDVLPKYNNKRTDIVQAVKFNDENELITFIQGIQEGSPVDSFVAPEPWDMPGYEDKVIMAAGGFIQGSSIELSADAPIRKPYIAYIQGGLSYSQIKLSIMIAVNNMIKKGYVNLNV
jgi:cystathionine beta-lyase family protein involved in aluminum resistance